MGCTTNHVQELDIDYSMTSQWTMRTKISWWREGEQIPERHWNSDNRVYNWSVYNPLIPIDFKLNQFELHKFYFKQTNYPCKLIHISQLSLMESKPALIELNIDKLFKSKVNRNL